MKLLTSALISAVLLAASPAYADRGDGHGRGHDRHYGKHAQKYGRGYHRGHYRHSKHRVVRREVHHYYQSSQPEPAYYPPSNPVGISVVLPTIFFPFT